MHRSTAWLIHRPLALTTLFYFAGLLVPALALRAWWFDDWLYDADLGLPSTAPIAAAVAGTTLLLVATPWMMRFDWARRIAALIDQMFGPLTAARAAWLGVVSAFCEELLFRGALQPVLGLLPASIAFALVHCIGGWWMFALAMGVLLGLLYNWDANLWPCVLAHALLNAVNLYRLSHLPLVWPDNRNTL